MKKKNPVKSRLKNGRYEFTLDIISTSKFRPSALEDSKLVKLLVIYDATGIKFDEVKLTELKGKNKYNIKGSFAHNDLGASDVKVLFDQFLKDVSQHYNVMKSSYNKK